MNIITTHSSPHFRTNRLSKVDTIIIHYISAVNIDKEHPFHDKKILSLLTKPIPKGDGTFVKVSAHYYISRSGYIYRLINEDHVAWHAGLSEMPRTGRSIRGSVNDFSIGIELAGGNWTNFTNEQYESLICLVKDIKNRHKIC